MKDNTTLIFPDQLMFSSELTRFLNGLGINVKAKTLVRDVDDEIIGVITSSNTFYEFNANELKKIYEGIKDFDINKVKIGK